MPNAVYCSVVGCDNNSRRQNQLSFFRFPVAKKRVQQWAKSIGRTDIIEKPKPSTYRVCSIHFTPDKFINKRLNNLAAPTINLPENPVVSTTTSDEPAPFAIAPNYTPSALSQTMFIAVTPQPEAGPSNSMAAPVPVPPDMSLVKDMLSMVQGNSTSRPNNFVSKYFFWHSELKHRFAGDTDGLRIYALNFYLTNPELYKLSHKNSILPSPITVRNTKIHFNPEVDLNNDLLDLLSKRLKANRHNYKFCTISISEISLKKNLYYDIGNDEVIGFHDIHGLKGIELAKYAFVMQLRGCAVDYKQPLGYVFLGTQNENTYRFLKEALKNWIFNCILRLNEAGFIVVAVISERIQILVDVADLFGVTVDNPYFEVDNKRIYYIYDIPQLLQEIYANLSMFKILDNSSKFPIWEYIEAFYKIDQQREVKLAPKLTAAHFRPISSSKASHAKDILSYEVAAGMSVDIEMGHLPVKAKHAVQFILKFCRFLDILNSKIGTLSNAKTNYEHLKNFLEYLQKVSIIKDVDDDPTDIIDLFKGMQITLNSILMLQNFCLFEGIKYNLIIKNAVGPFLSEIHKQSGISRELTPIQFRRAFSKLVLQYMFKNTPSHVSTDEQNAILEFKSALLFKNNMKVGTPALAVQTTDYRFDLPEKNGFTYFCGYLVRKISDKHFCPNFNHFKTYHEGYVRNNELLREFTAFNEGKKYGNLTVPSKKIITYIKIYEAVFMKSFEKYIIRGKGVGRQILDYYLTLPYSLPCPCFPNEYFIKIFLRFRLYRAIKLCNRNINRDDDVSIPTFLTVDCLYTDDDGPEYEEYDD